MTHRPALDADVAGLDALDARAAIEELRAVQREILRLKAEVDSATDRLRVAQRSVVWSGAAAQAWRATMEELCGDSSRGAEALVELHRLLAGLIESIGEGRAA